MRVNTFAYRCIATDLGNTNIFKQGFSVGSADINDGEVRQVHHADIFRHLQVLCVGNAPEMSVVPFMFAYWHFIAKLFQQVFVARITVRTFPAGGFHKTGAECFFAFVERAAPDTTTLGVRLTVVYGRVIYLEGGFVAAIVDVLFFLLKRVVAGNINATVIEFGAAVGHPVSYQLAGTRTIFNPHRNRIP